MRWTCPVRILAFPFLFGGTFIEAEPITSIVPLIAGFPFLFGGTFIEAVHAQGHDRLKRVISLPFRRDFH